MIQKLFRRLRPRLALLLVAALLAAMVPNLSLAAEAADRSYWEDRDDIKNASFTEEGTSLDSYTYYNPDTGEAEPVTVDPTADAGTKENPISISSEGDLILFGQQSDDNTAGKYYILDKSDGIYDMDGENYSMLPLFATLQSSISGMATQEASFEGILIGNGATITNAYIRAEKNSSYWTYPSLFGTLSGTSGSCQVMDLTIEVTLGSEPSDSGSFCIGGLAAETSGCVSLSKITANVAFDATSYSYSYFGGLIGYAHGWSSSDTVNITGCTVYLDAEDVEELYGLGGLVNCSETCTVNIDNCDVYLYMGSTEDTGYTSVGIFGGLMCYTYDGTANIDTSDVSLYTSSGTMYVGYFGGLMCYERVSGSTANINTCKITLYADSNPIQTGYFGGLMNYLYNGTTVTFNDCVASMGSGIKACEWCNGTLLGYAERSTTATFTGCTADIAMSGVEGVEYVYSYYPTAAVGYTDLTDDEWDDYDTDPVISYTGADTLSTIWLTTDNSVIGIALVNDTELDSVTKSSNVVTASVSASGNDTTGSASVSTDGSAEINICGGESGGGATYSLTNLTGVIQLEDNTSNATPAYWVTTADADFDSSDGFNPGDSVNLLTANAFQYTVYFYDPISNSYVDSQTVASGGTVTAPTDPTNDGYEFQGWYTDEDYTSSYVFDTAVTSSFTLYAKFAAISAITVDSTITNGTVTAPTSATAGATVEITVAPDENYELLTLTVTDADGDTVSTADGGSDTYTFTMPGSAVTITATFKNTTAYTITVPSGVTADVETALEGETVTLSVADSSTVRSLTVTDGDGNDVEVTSAENNTYTFTMPAADVTVSATFQDLSYYTITVPDGVTADPTTAQAGDTVTLTVDTSSYTVNSLTVTDGNSGNVTVTQAGAGTYTFTMPASSVTVNANLSAIVSVDSNITTTAADGEAVTNGPDTSSAASDVEIDAIISAAKDIEVSTTTDGSLAQAVSGESLSEISAAVQNTTEYQTKTENASSNSEITIHVETALSVTVNGAEVEESSSTVTAVAVEISPVYTVYVFVRDELVATFKDSANLNNIDLDVDGTVTIQMTVPSVLGCADGDTLYIQHKGYEYSATVKNGSITFDNPHGFSQFILSTTSKAAVQDENGTTYTSLQAAVNNANSGDTITVTNASGESLTATAKKTISIYNATGAAITVTINGKSYTIAAGATKTISYRSSSSSSSDSDDPATYSITMEDDTKNGTITLSATEASAGDTVTITVTPDQYYALASLTVTNSKGRAITVTDNGDGTYTFTMPASKVTIEASFEMDEDFLLLLEILAGAAASQNECPSEAYTDLDTSAWYHEAVDYVLENGLMTGTSATTFEPNTVTTRGMIATILYRLEGEPTVTGTSGFTDVVDGEWYADAVTWAAQNGIVNGYGNGCFGPYDVITREQMATILYNYALTKGYGFVGLWMFRLDYDDMSQISEWAYEPMCWMVMHEIITGTSTTILSPQKETTRAEAATILVRFIESLE